MPTLLSTATSMQTVIQRVTFRLREWVWVPAFAGNTG